MAINPLIALSSQVPDLRAEARFINDQIRRGSPLEERRTNTAQNKLLQQQTFDQRQVDRINSVGIFSEEIMPDLQAGNIDAVETRLQQRLGELKKNNINTEDTEAALQMLRTNPQQLMTRAQNAIQLRQRLLGGSKGEGFSLSPGQARFDASGNQIAALPESEKDSALVNVNLPSEKFTSELDKTFAQSLDKQLTKLETASDSSQEKIGKLQIAEQLLGQIQTGALTPTVQNLKKVAQSAGIDLQQFGITDNTAETEVFGSIAKDLAIEELQRLTGPKTDFEQKEIEKVTPTLSKTPEGNRLLIELGKSAAQRNIRLASFIDDFIASDEAMKMGARQLRSAVRKKQDQFLSENPLITEELKQRISGLEKLSDIDNFKDLSDEELERIANGEM